MNQVIDYDELFALRIFLQDEYQDESDIINELYFELRKKKIPKKKIPEILKEFYNKFGFDISLETIKKSFYNDSLNFFQMIVPQNLQNQENQNQEDQNQEDQEGQNQEDQEDQNQEEDNQNQNNQEHYDQDQDDDDEDENELYLANQIGNVQIDNIQIGNIQNTLPFYMPSTNQISILLNNILPNLIQTNNMEDVKTTLEEEDFNKLKKFKTDKKLDENCSICMGSIEIDEEVCQLPCNHDFHSECVDPWLKEYNYKCPVCRTEVGKGKPII